MRGELCVGTQGLDRGGREELGEDEDVGGGRGLGDDVGGLSGGRGGFAEG